MLSRRKNPKNLVQRAAITDDTQKAISEYFYSKAADRNIKKYPEWDVAKTGPEIKLLKAQRALLQAQDELDAKRTEYDGKRQYMDQQWAELRRKETSLREAFVKFDKFVKENREKRERAERKINEQKERQEKYTDEIKILELKQQMTITVRDKMKKYVNDYRRVQNYLELVVSETDEFQSINEIFNRYESLMDARRTLADHQNKGLEKLEEIGTNMQRMIEEREHKLMNLNNELATLQSRYDRIKTEALKWENVVSRIKVTAADKNLELTQIKSSCWNMYQQICKRKGIPIEISKDDIENQLVHIKRTILELKRIVKVVKEETMKKEENIKFQ